MLEISRQLNAVIIGHQETDHNIPLVRDCGQPRASTMLDVLLPCLLLLILEESVADARGTTSLSCYLSFSFMTCIKKDILGNVH